MSATTFETFEIGQNLRLLNDCDLGRVGETVVVTFFDQNDKDVPVKARRLNNPGDTYGVWLGREQFDVISGDGKDRSDHEQDINLIRDFLLAKAKENDWCEQFDDALDELNKKLHIKMKTRRPVFTFESGDVIIQDDRNPRIRDNRGEWRNKHGDVVFSTDEDLLHAWGPGTGFTFRLMVRDGRAWEGLQPGEEN